MVTALLAEGAVLALRKQPVKSRLADNSALLTALLLGISLPPLAPWWMIVLGTFLPSLLPSNCTVVWGRIRLIPPWSVMWCY